MIYGENNMTETLLLEKTNLSLVKKENLKDVLVRFGLEIINNDENGEEIIFKSEMDKISEISAKCEGCGTEINLNNFGHLAHGSKLIYCKNPVCFNHFLATKKIK